MGPGSSKLEGTSSMGLIDGCAYGLEPPQSVQMLYLGQMA